jgi:tRNA A-37 threonylcarbamoyl transferase component Bud32
MRNLTQSDVQRAKAKAVGGGRKRCTRGKSCSATCIDPNEACIVDLPDNVVATFPKVRSILQRTGKSDEQPDYSKWDPVAEGNYGKVSISPDGTRAVKELLVGKDGKKGEFGEYEIELAKKMGELGHSPRIYRATPDVLEMDVAKGAPLWKDYKRGEDEPRMNATQATKAAAAIQALHKMGFAHGDMHALQFLVDGNNVKLVDYGLSVPTSRQPVRVMQDLSKIGGLINWKNPELAGNSYVQLVNKYLDQYKEVKGTSQAAKNKKTQLGQQYLQELEQLQ